MFDLAVVAVLCSWVGREFVVIGMVFVSWML